jgi:hypothetical protein
MTDNNQAPQSTFRSALPYVIALILIGPFLWRVVVAAHEYPMRSEQVMTMLIDLGLLVGLIGMRERVPKALFWCAIVAGIGLFAIRLTGDAAWWTGHLSYSLLPR